MWLLVRLTNKGDAISRFEEFCTPGATIYDFLKRKYPKVLEKAYQKCGFVVNIMRNWGWESCRCHNACICHQIKRDDKMKAHWRGSVILRQIVPAEIFYTLFQRRFKLQIVWAWTETFYFTRFFDQFTRYLNVFQDPKNKLENRWIICFVNIMEFIFF